MTGPEHYRLAEELLTEACETHDGQPADTNIARAQVHATLALAAATALNDAEGGLSKLDWEAWRDTAGVKSEQAEVVTRG